MTTVALLNSRQAMFPDGSLPWVKRTLDAAQWAKQSGFTVIGSIGSPAWELTLAACSLKECRIELVVPNSTGIERIRGDFGLNHESISVIRIDQRTFSEYRDRLIIDTADCAVPISIRPGGSLETLLASRIASGKTVDRSFAVPYCKRSVPVHYRVNPSTPEPFPAGYLIHWTRACPGPWPDERPIDFYRDLFASCSYPRSAAMTLGHILTTGIVRASSRHINCKEPVVSFTAVAPGHFSARMRWRSRYRVMSFEPYGIGVERDCALSIGIKPVAYCNKSKDLKGAAEPWLIQTRGKTGDWAGEQEYRYRGDLLLRAIPSCKLALFCGNAVEAEPFHRDFALPVYSFQ